MGERIVFVVGEKDGFLTVLWYYYKHITNVLQFRNIFPVCG